MNIFNWKPQVFRDAEGEGAGGGGQSSGAQETSAPPAPANDQLAKFEERLARMSQQLDQSERQRETDAQKRKIEEYEGRLANAVRDTENAVATAEQNLADAFDNGEGSEIAKAQRALTEAVTKAERAKTEVENYKQRLRQNERREGGSTSQPREEERDTTNLNAWKSKHASWYGIDPDMTKAAHEIDRQIRDAGVLSVGSKEYFNAVDRAMSQRYPDKFGGTPNTPSPSGGNSAPQNRNRGRISQSIAEGWRRMGINVDDPKVVERMVKNRERAVQKGILPETPVEGPVRVR